MKKLLTLVLCLFALNSVFGQSMANYTFSSSTAGSLDPMIGATSLAGSGSIVTGYNDDYASAVTNIGFTFYFMSVPYTQFSANSNGQIRLGGTAVSGTNITSFSAGVPLLAPMAGDNSAGFTGDADPISYVVTGTAPNRILKIQWNNFQIPYNSSGTVAGKMQVWLYEGIGKIDMIYGAMFNNSLSSVSRSIFVASSNTATTAGYVTVSATPTFTLAASPTTNTFAANSNIANLYSAADGSRTVYTFTPAGATPADPTTLTFTAITGSTITPNWVDNSTNETYFIVTSATDAAFTQNVTTSIVVSTTFATTGTAYNLPKTGLVPSTTYYYKVQAANEGSAPSTGLTGSQITNAPGTITSNATGNWSDITTWSTGTIPTATDNVTIADGHTVYIDTAVATCLNLTVGQGASGILTFTCATASNLTVNGSVTVALGADFNAGTTATIVHSIYIGGNSATSGYASNLTVDGSFDMWATATTGRATLTFFGTQNSVISGTGANLDFNNTNIINKGATTATSTVTPPVLDLQRAFTVQGATTLGFVATHTAGTLKISGAFTQSNPVYTAAAYSVPANGGIWLNNANFTINGLTGSPTVNGLFRVTAGTYNVGTGAGNSVGSGTGSVYIIEGGAINVTGRFNLTSSGVYYNQSGGTISVAMVGNASSASASFGITSATGTSFIMSGGTIILVQRSTGATIRDYYVLATPTITGGTLQVGSAATATNFNFRMHGYAPNTIIDNTTNNKIIEVYQTSGNFAIIGNLTVNAGTTFDCLGMTASVAGNVVNDGIIQGLVAGSRFDFSGIAPQTYSGAGTFGTLAAPFIGTGVGIANTTSVTLNSPIVTTRVNLFLGTFINSAQITLGNGGTSTGFIQRGGSALYPAGIFDVAPNFNVGTGGLGINYYTASTATTSAYEIPASRAINNLIINNVNGAILSGGALTLGSTGTLTLTLGNLTTTSTNLLTLTNTTASAISGGSATSFVNGPMERTYAAGAIATGTYSTATILPIGYQTNYMPIYIDPTVNAEGPVVIKGEAFNTNTGSMGAGVTTISSNRWEALATSGIDYLISTFMRIGDASIISTNQILQASSAAGTYGAIPSTSTYAAGTPNTITTTGAQIPVASYFGYFAYGDLTPCTAPVDQAADLITSNMTTTSFTGSFTPAASVPSHYLVVRYASGATPTNPVDFTNYTAGGTLGTGTIVAVTTSNTFNSTGLTMGTTYDYYIYSFNNSGCFGPVYNSVAPLFASVTTCGTATGTPGTPTATTVLTTSFTASWTASLTAGVDYFLDVATDNAFTSFVSGFENKNEGTSLTDNITGLTANTTYYVRVRALSGTCYSQYTSTLIISTACDAEVAPTVLEDFSTFNGAAPAPICWSEATGVLAAVTTLSGTTGKWTKANGFANVGTNVAVKTNLYSTYNDWIISNPIDLGPTPGLYRLKYDMAVTSYNGTAAQSTLGTHRVDVVVSTDGGLTWSNTNVIKTYTGVGSYSNTGQTELINLSSYSGVIKIAFVQTTSSTSPDIDFHIDNFQVEALPSCAEPTSLNVTSLTAISATINWTASLSAPTGGYEYEVRTSGAAGSGATGLTASGSTAAGVVTANITGLTANTNYSYYVRSNCGSGLFSAWTSAGTFYTGYCNPAPSSVDGIGITNVTFSTVNNTTSTETNNYGDYSAMVGNVTQGATVPVSITFETGYTYVTKIWIDWNDDLDFADAGEEVYSGTSTNDDPTTLAASFIVPGTAPLGNHRMRIGGQDDGPTVPCYTGSYGSFEDYTVNVQAPVLPVITSLSATSGCVGTSLIINGTDLAGATSVTIGGTSATITDNTATTVTVTVGTGTTGTVSVTTIGGIATSTETFTVNQLPQIFTVSGGGTYCAGGAGVTIALDGSASGVNYDLSTTPVTTLAGTGSALTFGPSAFEAGVYTVTAIDPITTCSIIMTGDATVYVNPSPTAVTATASSNTICEGNSVDLFSSAISGTTSPFTILTESFENAGAIPTGWGEDLDVDGNSTNAALYYVNASVNPTGFAASDGTYFVRFNSYSVTSGNSARLKQTTSFSTVGYTGLTVNFAWTQDDGYTNNDRVEVQYSTDGTTWNTAGTSITRAGLTNEWTLQSVNLPVAAENQGTLYIAFLFTSAWGNDCHLDDVTVIGQTPAPATYSWTSNPAGFTSTDQNPIGVVPPAAGSIDYIVAANNALGCSTTATTTIVVDPCTGINENDGITVSVLPNPSNGLFYLNVEGINETVTLNIYAIDGKVIYSEQVDNTGLINKPIDLKSYPKGMYFLRLINNNMTHTEKIIIE